MLCPGCGKTVVSKRTRHIHNCPQAQCAQDCPLCRSKKVGCPYCPKIFASPLSVHVHFAHKNKCSCSDCKEKLQEVKTQKEEEATKPELSTDAPSMKKYFEIEEVLSQRAVVGGRELMVKFRGHSSQFGQWMSEEDVPRRLIRKFDSQSTEVVAAEPGPTRPHNSQ